MGGTKWWDAAWCNAGEFNVISYLSERLRFNRFSFEMFDFSDICWGV